MTPPLRVGFVRGIAPAKWARRWEEHRSGQDLELTLIEDPRVRDSFDVRIERFAPDVTRTAPAGRHAVHLYDEAVALVLPVGHELADAPEIDAEALALTELLDHPDHSPLWPTPRPWPDPAGAPATSAGVLDLVGAGLGAMLLPFPLARQLASRRDHVVRPLSAETGLAGTSIWATWAADRDAPDVQRFIGVLRGRSARSSRNPSAPEGGPPQGQQPTRASAPRRPPASSRTRPRRHRRR